MIDRIETKHLILRKAKDTDLLQIWHNVWEDTRLAKTMLWKPTLTLVDAKARLERTKAYQSEHFGYFVCLKETDEPIGFGGVREIEQGVYDETGICIAIAYQGRGYGKELLEALIGLVFDELGGTKFTYGCFHENAVSASLARSCGFVYTHSKPGLREIDGYAYCCDCFELTKNERSNTIQTNYVKGLRKSIGSQKIILNCAGAIIEQDGKILFQRRSDNGLWGLIGGLMELDETYEETALREVREETGLIVRFTAFLGIFHNHNMVWNNGDRAHTVGAYYLAEIVGGELRTDEESLELRFFSPSDIPDLFAEDHRAAIAAYLNGQRLPLLHENRKELL